MTSSIFAPFSASYQSGAALARLSPSQRSLFVWLCVRPAQNIVRRSRSVSSFQHRIAQSVPNLND